MAIARLIAGVHDIAWIDHAHAHAAVVRRLDIGVVEIGLRGFDRGDIGIDRGFILIDLGLLQIEVLLGLGIFQNESLKAREVFYRRGESGLVLRFARLGLIERGLIETRVDLRQHVALFDALAFLEKHFLQLAIDLGMNGDGV